MDFEELISRERLGDAELEIVRGQSWSPGRVGRFFGTIESEDAMGAANLGVAESGGLGLAKGTEFACAAMDNFAGELRIES